MAAYEYPLLIKHLLRSALCQSSRNEIVYRDLSRYGYEKLGERVGRLGSALAALGVRPGDTVAVMDWDSPRYLECYFAVPMLGAVLQTVNVRLSPKQVSYTVDHAGASTLLCNTEFLPLLQTIRAELPRVRRIIALSDTPELPDFAWQGEYERLLANADPAHQFPDFDENTRATTFYTTGTTRLPKGVYFSHRQLVLHTLAELYAVQLRPTDVYMPITPMFHVHAWGLPYAATLAALKQVYPGRYAPDVLIKLVTNEKVTLSHCVPTLLEMILGAAPRNHDFKGWRVIIGGSALPQALCRDAVARGIDVVDGYGMSETCPMLSISRVEPDLAKGSADEIAQRTKAGLPIPLVDFRIVDAEMRDVPHDSSGEVVVRAPWLTQGYDKDERASEALWAGGYLHTADIGAIDRDGYLRITDRIKDVIKSGGEWASSLQLEDIIAGYPGVAEVAVIAVEDEKWGERPLAIVAPQPGASLEVEPIKAYVMRDVKRGAISKFAVPESVAFVDNIEKTSAGKFDKKALREKYGKRGR